MLQMLQETTKNIFKWEKLVTKKVTRVICIFEVGVSAPFEKRKRTVFWSPGTVPWNGSKEADSKSE